MDRRIQPKDVERHTAVEIPSCSQQRRGHSQVGPDGSLALRASDKSVAPRDMGNLPADLIEPLGDAVANVSLSSLKNFAVSCRGINGHLKMPERKESWSVELMDRAAGAGTAAEVDHVLNDAKHLNPARQVEVLARLLGSMMSPVYRQDWDIHLGVIQKMSKQLDTLSKNMSDQLPAAVDAINRIVAATEDMTITVRGERIGSYAALGHLPRAEPLRADALLFHCQARLAICATVVAKN